MDDNIINKNYRHFQNYVHSIIAELNLFNFPFVYQILPDTIYDDNIINSLRQSCEELLYLHLNDKLIQHSTKTIITKYPLWYCKVKTINDITYLIIYRKLHNHNSSTFDM